MRFCHSLKAVLIDNSDEDNTHAVRCTSSVLKHLLTVFVKKNKPRGAPTYSRQTSLGSLVY